VKRIVFAFLAAAGLFCSPLPAYSQSATTAAIAGVVRDTTGAVLPGVTVEAASPALIEKVRTVVTDAQGNYKIIDLRPGTYSVTFTLPGFSAYKREGIELTTGFTAAVNGDMKVGEVAETVVVTGATPLVDVQNTRGQNVIAHDVIEALPAGRTNAGFAELTLGAASLSTGAGGSGAVIDQGGSKGDASQRLTVHGMRPFDQRIYFDGMFQMNLLSSGKNWQTNQIAVQETVISTGNGTGEVETAGMQINFIPKDGGNRFSGTFQASGTNGNLQNNNLNSAITDTGVTTSQTVKNIFDFGVGIGGPIAKDRVWFYSATRKWGSTEYQPGAFFNKSPTPYAYVADPSRPAYADLHAFDQFVRITWQATSKQKFNFSDSFQNSCQCYLTLNALVAPESAPWVHTYPSNQPILSWTYGASTHLLFDAGVSLNYLTYDETYDSPYPNASRITEASTGLAYGGQGATLNTSAGYSRQPALHQRATMSYVSGSHAFKFGEQWLDGFYTYYQQIPNSLSYSFLRGVPSSLTQWAVPVYWYERIRNIGLYAQDQWTFQRLTVNYGVRYDHYAGWIPAGTRAATIFSPAFSFGEVDSVPNFNDINPRAGAAWDVFGNGKTAIKGAFGRYVAALGVEFQDPNNPALALVTSATRTWNDANANFTPDCNLTSNLANGECGAISNALFGQPFRNTTYDPSSDQGFANRTYSWQGNIGIQQQLQERLSLAVTYYRTWYHNFLVTDNTAVASSDFSPYCVTAPVDARLPGGGGNQICGLYDVNPNKFGQVTNLVTAAGAFGEQVERYDGIDALFNARFAHGGIVQGGVSFGRQSTNNCYVNTRPDLSTTNTVNGGIASGVGISRTAPYCDVVPPWAAGTQLKASGYYPLPWWGIEPSFAIQNLPGAAVSANATTSNAAIAPSLGRNLAAGPNGTVTINLIPPQSVFLDRVTNVDVGLSKVIKTGRTRVKGTVNVYNVFNVSSVLLVNGTYGPTWLRPTSIIGGRLFKFGAQVDF
jgi:hypothetical protein